MLRGNFNQTAAGARYTRRFLPMMVFYVVVLLSANWAAATYKPTGIAMFLLALAPALPLVGAIGIMGWYFFDEKDEYLRQRLAIASLVGTGFVLVITTIWGFLEEGGQLPHLPGYSPFILWCFGMGLAQCIMSWRTLGDDK